MSSPCHGRVIWVRLADPNGDLLLLQFSRKLLNYPCHVDFLPLLLLES